MLVNRKFYNRLVNLYPSAKSAADNSEDITLLRHTLSLLDELYEYEDRIRDMLQKYEEIKK